MFVALWKAISNMRGSSDLYFCAFTSWVTEYASEKELQLEITTEFRSLYWKSFSLFIEIQKPHGEEPRVLERLPSLRATERPTGQL